MESCSGAGSGQVRSLPKTRLAAYSRGTCETGSMAASQKYNCHVPLWLLEYLRQRACMAAAGNAVPEPFGKGQQVLAHYRTCKVLHSQWPTFWPACLTSPHCNPSPCHRCLHICSLLGQQDTAARIKQCR